MSDACLSIYRIKSLVFDIRDINLYCISIHLILPIVVIQNCFCEESMKLIGYASVESGMPCPYSYTN